MIADAERCQRLRQQVRAVDQDGSLGTLSELDALFTDLHHLQLEHADLAKAQAEALVHSAMIVSELENAKHQLEQEVSRRKQAETMIRAVVEGTARATGEDFFRSLTQHLAQALGMQYAIVGELVLPERDRVRVLASWCKTEPGASFTYDIAGTPCEKACHGQLCYIGDDVQAQFPDDAMLGDMDVRSYIGTPLWDAAGTTTLGIIAVLGEDSLDQADLAGPILEVFAMRAAAELERTLYEAEMRAAQRTAELASQAKTRFLARMSHEVRTPLNGVLGTADILGATELDEEQAELVDVIRDAGGCLLAIVNDVLDLSKIEAEKLQLQEAPFDIASQANSVVQLLRPRAGSKGLDLTCVVAEDVPSLVIGDALRVRQILTNLVGNAVRYTNRGSVEVRVAAAWVESRSAVRLTVRDTGPGISADNLERIFDRFEQADSASGKGMGTGLGLSIARQLAELMGGNIAVESEVGHGSTFSATLPLATARDVDSRAHDAASQQPAGACEERHWPGVRVLVAEDNPINQIVVQRLLRQLGCEVEVVPDGAAAIERVRNSPFDLVLMDSQMPGVDGPTATSTIRAELSALELPIVSLTANAFEDHREVCLAAGANDFVTKPIRARDMRRVLARWCSETE